MKRLCAILLSIMMLCSIMVVSVSAEDSYDCNGFSIETTLAGKWSEKETTIGNFECTVYTFNSDSSQLIITINESDPQGFVGYVKDELVPESFALDIDIADNYEAYTIDIDGQEFSVVQTYELEDNNHFFQRTMFAYAGYDNTGYYIEMRGKSDPEYYLLLDSICNMEIAPKKSGIFKSISGMSDDEINITTIICVGIITSGIVALGISAMVIFGKKRKKTPDNNE